MMSLKNINLTKMARFGFALLMILSLGVCFALSSLSGDEVALAANDATGSIAVGSEVSTFQERVETGASITLKATANESTVSPNPAIAEAQASETAVITLTGDLWKAVVSGRITATLYASGSNSYLTAKGTAGTKDAGFTVSGAMSGSGKFSSVNTTYEDRVLADKTVLNAENGNEIRINYYATHVAHDTKVTLGENVAEASVDGVMTFTLELSFEEVVFTIGATANGGRVQDASGNVLELGGTEQEVSIGFGERVSFTALPNDGYYFVGWKKTGTMEDPVTGITLDLGDAVDMPSGQAPSYNAQFRLIEYNKENEYVYSGSPVGPVVRSTAYTGVYYLTHRYTGTTTSGESIDFSSEGTQDIVSAPIRAGSFNYTCEFYYRVGSAGEYTKGEKIGGLSVDFETKKNDPIVTRGSDNASTINLSYGDDFESLDLSYKATNSVDKLVNLTGSLEVYLGENKIDVTKLLPLSEEGTDYTLRFTPTDLNNYNVVDSVLRVYVKDNMIDEGTNILEGVREYSVTKSIVNASDVDENVPSNFASLTVPEGGELVKISMRATMKDESGQFFFLGWRIGLHEGNSYIFSYVSEGKVNRDASNKIESIEGLDYDYYLPYRPSLTAEEFAKYATLKIQAVFLKDNTCGDSPDTINTPYKGSPAYTLKQFDLDAGVYGFTSGEFVYYHASDIENGVKNSIPYAIGTHYIKYDIIIADSRNFVDTRVITYNVTLGNLNVKINDDSMVFGGYNANTGWARQMYYDLTVERLLSGGAEAYYYSTDNGENWTKIEGTIASSDGCKISFVTPEVVNDTQVSSYVFMATHDTNGTPTQFGDKTYMTIAGTYVHTVAKIDTVEPTLADVTETTGFNGAWTMLDVEFSATASYGGSGAVIDVCYVDSSSNFIKINSYDLSGNELGFATGYDQIKTENQAISFKIDTQYNGEVRIRIRTGTGLIYESSIDDAPSSYLVKIDKTAPLFGAPEKDKTPNTSQGWIGETTKVSFDLENEGGAPLKEITATDQNNNPVEIKLGTDGKYYITISDSMVYFITAQDEAGNSNNTIIQEQIDVVKERVVEAGEGSYVADSWAKIGSKVIIKVTMGASGARLRCSIDNGSFIPVTDFIGSELGQVNCVFNIEYELPYSDVDHDYNFQIETGTGDLIDYKFGKVKFDVEAPVYTLITNNLDQFQGTNWTSTKLDAEFTATDMVSGIKSVTADNNGKISSLGGNRYSLSIDKCTVFTITIEDKAGNVTYATIQANVDMVDPTLILKAYVGGGNPDDANEEPSAEDNDVSKEYDFNKWITQNDVEPWVRLEFTIVLTASGSKLEYSNNGTTWTALTPVYMPENADAVGETINTRTYIKTEQNKKYRFRLATGSGKYVEYTEQSDIYVRLDFTAPTASESFRVGNDANFDLKNKWINQDGQYRVMLRDTLTGSGADSTTLFLKEYDLDASDEEIRNGVATATLRSMTMSGDAFVYNMTEAKKYLLYFKDIAGNEYQGDIFVSHVDKTDGFTLAINPKHYVVDDGSAVASTIGENTWLGAEDYVVFEIVQNKGFGPSGGALQFSIDGGETYQSSTYINGEAVAVTPHTYKENTFEVRTSIEQYYTYKFRLITGAGVICSYDKDFTVRKDNIDPEIVSTLTYQNGSAYSGEWTNQNLRFSINVLVGVSGGELLYGVGESEDDAIWTSIMELPKNVAERRTYGLLLDSSTSGNYYFKVVSGRPDVSLIGEDIHVVKLDNTRVEVSAIAKKVAQSVNVENGSWVDRESVISPLISNVGQSGVSKVYVKRNLGDGYGDYEEVVSEGYVVTLNQNTNALWGYVFKVVSASGMEAETEEFIIGYDDVFPWFNYTLTGANLPAGNLYEDWYVSDVEVSVTLNEHIVSGYQVYYAYKDNVENAEYSEWVAVEDDFTLTDGSLQGGKDRYYKFRVISGSGIIVDKDATRIAIDTFKYTVKVDLFVGDKASDQEHAFAGVEGEGEYSRGSAVTVTIIANDTYKIKAINEIMGENPASAIFSRSYEASLDSYDIIYNAIGNESIIIEAYFYKEITIEYDSELLRQCLQLGEIKEVDYSAQEEGFDDFFGALIDKTTRSYSQGDNTYARAKDVKKMGEYEVVIESNDVNFVLMNPFCRMVIVYFANNGTILDPYQVSSLDDFYYIDEYMHYETGYDVLDPRAYLVENLPLEERINRRNANFKQTASFELVETFVPNGDKGDGYTNEFKGSYDGNGYEITYNANKAFATKGDFGLFLNVGEGAAIINLGVRYNLRVEEAGGANVGLVVANLAKGGIASVYAIGNIYVSGSQNVNVGGIAGTINSGSLISESFADVTISVGKLVKEGQAIVSSGNVGGMVGYASGAYTANVYTVSRITLTDCEKYSATASADAKFVYAGAVLGYIENLEEAGATPRPGNESYYLDNNVSYDGSIEKGLSLGNRDTFGQYASLRHAGTNIDFFASEEEGGVASHKIINVSGRSLTVKELVNVRINEIKALADLQGEGTTQNPFLVDSQAKLAYVETFPWATFKQTKDITLNAENGAVAFAQDVPFVGVYDGDNYSIICAKFESDSTVYGGLFGVVSGTIKNLNVQEIAFTYSGENELYVGGLVGVLEGGIIQNVVVTGTLQVNSTANIVYVGGLVGVMLGGNIDNTISMVNVSVLGANVIVGGVVGEAQYEANIQNVVNLSAVSAHYIKKANVGATLGAVNSEDAYLQGIYHLIQNAYANDKAVDSAIGYVQGARVEDVKAKNYQDIMNVSLSNGVVQEVIASLYPFEGSGTKEDPFQIDSYEKLELIGNYMYAHFILTKDIVIGDWNEDGKLDSTDDYDYGFEPIGKGATFTGSLNGNRFSILGLSDSLFAVNAGAVRDITLNVNYKVYARANDVPQGDKVIDTESGEEYTSSKVVKENEDILFGALANVNTATGSIIRVTVTGEMYVRTKGSSKVTLGGIVGVDMGGQVVASQITANVSVRASQMIVGGIIGEIKYSDRALAQLNTNYVTISEGIDLGGGTVIAGAFVGKIGVTTAEEPTYATSTEIIVNGVSLGNEQYVGLAK